MTGHVSTTISAGDLMLAGGPTTDGRHYFKMGPELALFITPQTARQWVNALNTIAEQDNA